MCSNLFLIAAWTANSIFLPWTVGYSEDKASAPKEYVAAEVPGTAQYDLAQSLHYQDYKYADNFKNFSRMEDVYFTYRTSFQMPEYGKGERVWFHSNGIDYSFEIRLNGDSIFAQEGMFTPVDVDLTDRLKKENVLEVWIDRVPKCTDKTVDRNQAAMCVKPPVSYGWDWHPRLIPSGIWDDTYLEIRNKVRIEDHFVDYVLSPDFTKADIEIQTSPMPKEVRLEWSLTDRDGRLVKEVAANGGEDLRTTLDNPHLWWCHDQGDPYLYSYTLVAKDRKGRVLDTAKGRIGFRTIRLVMNTGAWDEPASFPKSRSNPPAQFELNGRRIFAKGSNWLAPDIFVGRIKRDDYDKLLDYVVEANFNTLRCWGGCGMGKESFFELCDEKGILVWQEFPLACNNYPDDSHYLKILRQEATSILKRLRQRPCMALWCGGNELFNSWSGMTDQSLALRLLNALCLELSPKIPFNYTSPLAGMAHGCYLFRLGEEEVFEWMNRSHATAYTEFGIPGASPVEVLRQIIPEEELFPAKKGTSWEWHHAFKSWGDENTWLAEPTLTYYYGQAQTLEQLVENSQMLQCEGYKCIYEEARRQKPYCAMALNWCYNEPWPAAANNSLIVWPAIKKPAFDAVKASCRPLCASARMDHYLWKQGESFTCEPWILNDSYDVKGEAYNVSVSVETLEGEKVALTTAEGNKSWQTKPIEANANQHGPAMGGILPSTSKPYFKLLVKVDGHPEMNSEYRMAIK